MAQDIDPRGVGLYILLIISFVLVWTSIILRAIVKTWIIKRVGLDDWLMLLSVFIYTAHASISLWGITIASKQAQIDHRRAHSIALKSWFLCEVIYAPLSALVRTSIAVFLLQFAVRKAHRLIIYTNLGVIWILCIVYFLLFVLQCTPTSYFYLQVVGQAGSCIAPEIVPRATIAHSTVSAMTDLVLALLPIAILWDLQLERRKKMGIVALLGMGLFAGVALIIRIPYVKFTPIASPKFLDQTSGVGFWSVMEVSLGIIAGCIATLRPLIRRRKARHQQEMVANSNSTRDVESRVTRDGYTLPNSPASEDLFPGVPTVIRPSSGMTRRAPEAFESDYLARLSRSRAWVKRRSAINSRPISPCTQPPEVYVRTNIEVTREVPVGTGRGPPSAFLRLSGGENVVSIYGQNNRARSTHWG